MDDEPHTPPWCDEMERDNVHFGDEHVNPEVGERLTPISPLEAAFIQDRGRPPTEAERGMLGLTSANGSYVAPDAHPRCQRC